MNIFNVSSKVVVITGGYGVLGSSLASCFVQHGAKVVILGRNRQKGEMLIQQLSKVGSAIFVEADVNDAEQIERATQTIIDQWGEINVLINAAGGNMPGATISPTQTFFDLNLKDLQAVFNLNYMGTVIPSMIMGKQMAKQGCGAIINISSMAAQSVITRVVGYSNAKGAVDNFTKWLAVELAMKFGEKLRVNAIAPGFFLTEQNRSLLLNEDGSYTDRAQDIVRNTPFKRMGAPEELNGTALWLASEASAFVTGVVVPVDGGFSVFSGV